VRATTMMDQIGSNSFFPPRRNGPDVCDDGFEHFGFEGGDGNQGQGSRGKVRPFQSSGLSTPRTPVKNKTLGRGFGTGKLNDWSPSKSSLNTCATDCSSDSQQQSSFFEADPAGFPAVDDAHDGADYDDSHDNEKDEDREQREMMEMLQAAEQDKKQSSNAFGDSSSSMMHIFRGTSNNNNSMNDSASFLFDAVPAPSLRQQSSMIQPNKKNQLPSFLSKQAVAVAGKLNSQQKQDNDDFSVIGWDDTPGNKTMPKSAGKATASKLTRSAGLKSALTSDPFINTVNEEDENDEEESHVDDNGFPSQSWNNDSIPKTPTQKKNGSAFGQNVSRNQSASLDFLSPMASSKNDALWDQESPQSVQTWHAKPPPSSLLLTPTTPVRARSVDVDDCTSVMAVSPTKSLRSAPTSAPSSGKMTKKKKIKVRTKVGGPGGMSVEEFRKKFGDKVDMEGNSKLNDALQKLVLKEQRSKDDDGSAQRRCRSITRSPTKTKRRSKSNHTTTNASVCSSSSAKSSDDVESGKQQRRRKSTSSKPSSRSSSRSSRSRSAHTERHGDDDDDENSEDEHARRRASSRSASSASRRASSRGRKSSTTTKQRRASTKSPGASSPDNPRRTRRKSASGITSSQFNDDPLGLACDGKPKDPLSRSSHRQRSKSKSSHRSSSLDDAASSADPSWTGLDPF